MIDQSQSGGLGSTNLQIGQVKVGLGYSEARALFLDLFDDNIAKMRAIAKETADQRAAELHEALILKFQEKEIADLEAFKQPEKQFALIDAQRAIALSGDEGLRGMLVDALVTIAGEPERSLKSIVLQEAIKVMPTLTRTQIGAIALCFIVRMVGHNGAGSGKELFDSFAKGIGKDLGILNFTRGDFSHIEYSRCGTVELGEVDFRELLVQSYPGLLSKGLTEDEFRSRMGSVIPNGAAMMCLNNGSLLQVAALNDWVLERKATTEGWNPNQVAVLKELLKERPMDASELDHWLKEQGEFAVQISEKWTTTSIKSLKLTSVGAAIGHSFACANGLSMPDVSIWL